MHSLLAFARQIHDLAGQIAGLTQAVQAWRDVGDAVKRVAARHPGLETEIELERQAVRAEKLAAAQRPEPAQANLPPDGI